MVGVVGGVVGGVVEVPPPQATPLRVKAVGEVFVPLYEALKPKLAVPPVAIAPLYDRLAADTAAPVWVTVAFQPWVTFWPPVKSKARLQLLTAAALLVIFTAP